MVQNIAVCRRVGGGVEQNMGEKIKLTAFTIRSVEQQDKQQFSSISSNIIRHILIIIKKTTLINTTNIFIECSKFLVLHRYF